MEQLAVPSDDSATQDTKEVDVSAYGSRGHRWHPEFVKYIESMANHEVYAGMPDAFRDDGTVQWEAPSNRKSGKYQHTHSRRLDWWRRKAREVGIDPESHEWISRTAKLIHPTGRKPCKRCGRYLDIAYAYPTHHLENRIHKLKYVPDTFEVDRFEHITVLITRLVREFGNQVYRDLPTLLKAKGVKIPSLPATLEAWLTWIEESYIPQEPSMLSPGAMSNAPDRFDGFHSFNRCCRPQADPGRHRENLRSYNTDRRVFEHWNEGDWITADRLMSEVVTTLRAEECRFGHPGPCSPDHIGPLSLGFTHRPEFQLLCSSCNSGKNNRMFLSDVEHLRAVEMKGIQVASWYAKPLWDLRKHSVDSEETAVRLSRMLRDNRHSAMAVLKRVYDAGHYCFLTTFLVLECADYDVEFVDLRVEDHYTCFDEVTRTPRETKYAMTQKVRRLKVAMDSLREYFTKENRNEYVVHNPEVQRLVQAALHVLTTSDESVVHLNEELHLLLQQSQSAGKGQFADVLRALPAETPENFVLAKRLLSQAMTEVARELSAKWDDDRYVRAALDE